MRTSMKFFLLSCLLIYIIGIGSTEAKQQEERPKTSPILGRLAFYGCDYVQNLVSVKGAANPFMFVVLLVGVQGVAEFLVSGILGGIVARAVAKFLK